MISRFMTASRRGRTSRAPAPWLLCAGMVAALAAVLATAAPASAATSPTVPAPHPFKARSSAQAQAATSGTPPLVNITAGPVQNAPKLYVVFWDWTTDPSGEAAYLTNFLSTVATNPWLATVNQYGGNSQAVILAGTWSDPTPVPSVPTEADIRREATSAAAHFSPADPVNAQIIVATPTGHSTAATGTSYCAYHSVVPATPTVPYTYLPYLSDVGAACGQGAVNGAAGVLDGVSIAEGNELAETITDPLLASWKDQTSRYEIGDLCAGSGLSDITTLVGSFAVQPLWSNASNRCVLASTGGDGTTTFEAAFQANATSMLWTAGQDSHGTWDLGMMPGTSPSIARLANGGYVVAFQANTGDLWTASTVNGVINWGLGMKAGTSPSVTGLSNGNFEVAFQANTGYLWTVGYIDHGAWNVPMMPGTSPSIAADPFSGYEVAVQASNGNVWTVNSTTGAADLGLGMANQTSPSITSMVVGGYEIAFQANTTALWTTGAQTRAWNLGMMHGTSPSVTGLPDGGYQVAAQANTGNLWTVNSVTGGTDMGLGMASGTSPSIAATNGSYEIGFQANTGYLWTVGFQNTVWGLGLLAGTSPSITAM